MDIYGYGGQPPDLENLKPLGFAAFWRPTFFPDKTKSMVSRGHKEKTRAKLREPTLSGCCFVPFSLFWILNWDPQNST